MYKFEWNVLPAEQAFTSVGIASLSQNTAKTKKDKTFIFNIQQLTNVIFLSNSDSEEKNKGWRSKLSVIWAGSI